MDYTTLAAVFPVVAAATPVVTQAIKQVVDPYLLKNPDHDIIMRDINAAVATAVGVVALIAAKTNPTTAQDWILVLVALFAYAVGGGAAASGVYGFLNGWLHQTPPVTTPKAVTLSGPGVVTTSETGARQPY